MFFKVFLLAIFLEKVTSSYIAEQDYYKHSDDYDDYGYDYGISDENTDKSVDRTAKTHNPQPDSNKATENDIIRKYPKKLIKDDENEGASNLENTNNTLPTSTTDDNDITYVLTDKPSEVDNNLPGYEVTEIIDDIPNPVTYKPIVTNFTIKPPLNIATGINNGNNTEKNKKGNRPRKNSISIFHVNAEFDDDKKKPIVHHIIHKIPLSIFNVDNFKDDVHYIHETEEQAEHAHYLPNILSAPKNFFNLLREKSSAFFHKFFK